MKEILAIDPGLSGALVYMNSLGSFCFHEMPIHKIGGNREIDFLGVRKILKHYEKTVSLNMLVLLERAHPGAMGVVGAFNYGRGFAAIEIALDLTEFSYMLLEPAKWAKVMHAGIKKDYKPKAKSIIAVKRLYKKIKPHIPTNRNGKLHEGIVDALLMAGYGLRKEL